CSIASCAYAFISTRNWSMKLACRARGTNAPHRFTKLSTCSCSSGTFVPLFVTLLAHDPADPWNIRVHVVLTDRRRDARVSLLAVPALAFRGHDSGPRIARDVRVPRFGQLLPPLAHHEVPGHQAGLLLRWRRQLGEFARELVQFVEGHRNSNHPT